MLLNFLFRLFPVTKLRKILSAFKNTENHSKCKTIYVDVSEFAKKDAKTGIQRVVRNIYTNLLVITPDNYMIVPVFASGGQDYMALPADFMFHSNLDLRNSKKIFSPLNGDIFLGLDLSAHIIPKKIRQLTYWKLKGVKIYFLVYDLLPLKNPTWFNKNVSKSFSLWMRTLAVYADELIAISNSVKIELQDELYAAYGLSPNELESHRLHLGSELYPEVNDDDSMHLSGTQEKIVSGAYILVVGTIEPRKAHDEILSAFEYLWARGSNIQLVIAGKKGWKVERLVNYILGHKYFGKRLHWLDSPSDRKLINLYINCKGVLMASKGEGYGLPVVEAMRFNKPILLRDIKVFREITNNATDYFPSTKDGLLNALPLWIEHLEDYKSYDVTYITWNESCMELLKIMKINQQENLS